MKRITLLTVLYLSLVAVCMAQKITKVHGTGTYTMSDDDHVTLAQAKENCIMAARLNAIKDAFGEKIAENNSIIDVDNNGVVSTNMRFEMLTSTLGDWVGTTKEPEISVKYEDGKLLFTAEVWGEAREVIQAKPTFTWKVLCGGTSDSYEGNKFKNKERIYISFRAPSSGYVAVYVWHGNDEVDCLLPYHSIESGRYKVDGGKKYVLFDKQYDQQFPPYIMQTENKLEYNQIILIYSPNSFVKCDDHAAGSRNPRSLSYEEFRSWLEACKRADSKMVDVRQWVTIHNDN